MGHRSDSCRNGCLCTIRILGVGVDIHMNRCKRCNIRFAVTGRKLCYPCEVAEKDSRDKRRRMYFNRQLGGGEGAQSQRWSSYRVW